MITRARLDWLRDHYDGHAPEDIHVRQLADAYEEQRDDALTAWQLVLAIATEPGGRPWPAEVGFARAAIAKLKETLK